MSEQAAGWRWRHLLDSPHRLGFFLAMLVLCASAVWWAGVQVQRSGAVAAVPMPVAPTLVHAAVMTLGFFPLFFCGFLFTAAPRWLHVPGPAARNVAPAFGAQAGGWLVWLAGSHVDLRLAVAGLALAGYGLLHAAAMFWRLVASSSDEDRVHPIVIAAALAFGAVCIVGIGADALLGRAGAAPRFALSGLWGCDLVVFAAAGHRMIPFFHPAPGARFAPRSDWSQLALLVGAAVFESACVWLRQVPWHWWTLGRAAVELGIGATLLSGALAWRRAKDLRHRLLRMMHTGVVWIGLGFVLQGATSLADLLTGAVWLPLAPLHALAMGGLGSLMLAMVTRVSAAHAGLPVAADDFAWRLFWLLQLATLLRLAATLGGAPAQPLLTAAALTWAGLLVAWALRYGSTYGRPPRAPRRR